MSDKAVQPTTPGRAYALAEFLPERVFNLGVRGDGERGISTIDLLSPNEVRLDPIEDVHHPATVGASVGGNPVQLWPLLAAGFVALGVTLLVLTIFAKFLHTVV